MAWLLNIHLHLKEETDMLQCVKDNYDSGCNNIVTGIYGLQP